MRMIPSRWLAALNLRASPVRERDSVFSCDGSSTTPAGGHLPPARCETLVRVRARVRVRVRG